MNIRDQRLVPRNFNLADVAEFSVIDRLGGNFKRRKFRCFFSLTNTSNDRFEPRFFEVRADQETIQVGIRTSQITLLHDSVLHFASHDRIPPTASLRYSDAPVGREAGARSCNNRVSSRSYQ